VLKKVWNFLVKFPPQLGLLLDPHFHLYQKGESGDKMGGRKTVQRVQPKKKGGADQRPEVAPSSPLPSPSVLKIIYLLKFKVHQQTRPTRHDAPPRAPPPKSSPQEFYFIIKKIL
jgi:hypothetical protein